MSTQEEKDYAKHYRETHKPEIVANRKRYYLKNLERFRKEGREDYREQRKKALELIGDKCLVCGYSGRKLTFHEIHGKNHDKNMKYLIEHPKDFVPLCYPHHRLLHFLFSLSPEDHKVYKRLLRSLTKEELTKRQEMGDGWNET